MEPAPGLARSGFRHRWHLFLVICNPSQLPDNVTRLARCLAVAAWLALLCGFPAAWAKEGMRSGSEAEADWPSLGLYKLGVSWAGSGRGLVVSGSVTSEIDLGTPIGSTKRLQVSLVENVSKVDARVKFDALFQG